MIKTSNVLWENNIYSKCFYNVFVLILFFIIAITPNSFVYGQLNDSYMRITYDQCSASLIVRFTYKGTGGTNCTDDDELRNMEITYTDGTQKGIFYIIDRTWGNFPADIQAKETAFEADFPTIDFSRTSINNPDGDCPVNFQYLAPPGTQFSLLGAGSLQEDSNNDPTTGALVVIPIPPYSNSTMNVTVNGVWQIWSTAGRLGTSDIWGSPNSPIQTPTTSIANVQGFSATTNLCNTINLTWDQFPALPASEACTYADRKLYIDVRNPNGSGGSENWRPINQLYLNVPVTPIAYDYYRSTATSPVIYTPNSFLSLEDHEFRIRQVHTPNAYRSNTSSYSTRTGRLLPRPTAPSTPTVSNMGCEGDDMIISWSYAPDPVSFTLQRATNMAFTEGVQTITSTIAGDLRQYTDVTAEVSQRYYYRIAATNQCPYTSQYSAPKEGFIEGVPDEPSNVVAVPTGAAEITVSWTDNSDFDTGFILERTFTGGGSALIIPIDATDTSYVDSDVNQCVTYTYRIKTKSRCFPVGVGTQKASAILAPDLSTAFPQGGFIASKGSYPDKIELTWNNTLQGATNFIKIYRKVLNAVGDSTLLITLNSGSGIHNDLSASAGELYEYTIVAEGPCEGTTIKSNIIQSIGYRRKSGIVTGRVSYEDGTAVADVSISASDPGITVLPSLLFHGSDIATVVHSASLNMEGETLVESWVKPISITYNTGFTLLNKQGAYSLVFNYNSGLYEFSVNTNLGLFTVTVSKDALPIGDWNSISGQMANDSLKIFVSGNLMNSIPITPSSNIVDNTNNVLIGTNYRGFLKDVRIWNRSKSERRIQQNHSRFLTGNELGLVMYLYMGEGKGKFAYDLAHLNTTYYMNHASLSLGITWDNTENANASNNKRLADLISISTFTDTSGNYNLVVPFSGAGQTFVITPVKNIHKFLQPTEGVYIGDGSSVQNGVDFIDVSTFRMTGTVLYKDMNCGVPGAFILIDGIPVRDAANKPIQTNSVGYFDIRVPIGPHVITIDKDDHVFSQGRFPVDSTLSHNFQEPVLEKEFIDATLRKVVGRAVGGSREPKKPIGLGRSKNNIGMVELTFDPIPSTSGSCGWYYSPTDIFPLRADTLVRTDSITGEFEVWLPPLSYDVLNIGNDDVSFDNEVLDISKLIPETTIIDTVFQPGTKLVDSIDKVTFYEKLEFIHRVLASIDVTNEDGTGPIESDELYISSHVEYGKDTIQLTPNNPFPFPIFSQNKIYKSRIFTFEEYVNNDSEVPVVDRVPVLDGVLSINNELATNTGLTINLGNDPNYDGDTLYIFKGGRPNINADGTEERSYTKEFRVTLGTQGSSGATWEPLYKGYLVGTEEVAQSDAVVNGPALVSYILRDPPGSQSFAERSVETKSTTEKTFEWNVGGGGGTDIFVNAGVKFETGIGYVTPFAIESSTNISVSTSASGGQGGSLIETLVATETWKTSEDPLLAGPQSDLFIGTSDVFLFGVSTTLALVPSSACVNSTITCRMDLPEYGSAKKYRLATIKRLTLAKTGIATDFVLPRWAIETDEIPDLIEIRNAYIDEHPQDYTDLLDRDHPCYGYNNDDPRLGTPDCPNTFPGTGEPAITSMADRSGPSYTFNSTDPQRKDSIRIWNQSIRLWEEVLALDEKQKFEAINSGLPSIGNKSFKGGGSSYSRTISNGVSVVAQQQFEFELEESLEQTFGAEIAGVGGSDKFQISLTQNTSTVDIQTADTTHTVSFTLSDDSEWDDFTVDIYEGSAMGSPIFNVLGGRSSCPHEGPFRSKYFQPGTLLSSGTIQLEQPEILISPSVLFNVPQDESGVFQMTLKNNNQVNEAWEYSTQIINTSNPNSLAINVGSSDDLSLNWVIPPAPNGQITRDFFVDIGTAYEYDSIMVVIHSTCQYQQGLSVEPDIVDTAYFSINFIPGCTDIELSNPGDQWVFNESFDNVMEIEADGYNINYLNFDNLRFEYKPSNTSNSDNSWRFLETFYKDSSILLTNPLASLIPRSTSSTSVDWDLRKGATFANLPDGNYDLRAISNCLDSNGVLIAKQASPIYRGYIDRIRPHAFGTPSPEDGILDPGDDILIRFNEEINIGSVGKETITVSGVLNGSPLSENASVAFDGMNDYAVIPEYQLQNREFTIEFWLKRDRDGVEEVILSQSSSPTDQLLISFNADNTLHFQIGDAVGDGSITQAVTADNVWHHYAISYERGDPGLPGQVLISVDNFKPSHYVTNIVADYSSTGPIFIGRHEAGGLQNFQGKMRELRLWNIYRNVDQIAPKSTVQLSGREAGLVGNWQMNEAYGNQAHDKVRSRHMILNGATWSVDPASKSYLFNGSSSLLRVVNAGQLSLLEESDITFEMWIKTPPGTSQNMTLLANGIPANDSSFWNLFINPNGNFVVANNGNQIVAPIILNDNNWHHMAVVVQRNQSVLIYHNGELVQTGNSSLFTSFGGPSLYLGAMGVQNNNTVDYSAFFNGHLDDVRIWGLARQSDQIERDFVNQMKGDEPGLEAYYPFDKFSQGNGIYQESLEDASGNNFDLIAINGNGFSPITPTIKLPRSVTNIPYTRSINGDEIFIETNIAANLIENVTLDISVIGVQDLAGNSMLPRETWIAYINKNQVFWEEEYFKVEKDINGTVSFTGTIKNIGGSQQTFTLSNIPSWLNASTQGGVIPPNSNLDVTFTVLPGINIGEYEQDIYVSTQPFNFNERLLLDLKVTTEPPAWAVNSKLFDYSMNIIGEFKINNVISTDDEDLVSVWIDGELRGVSNVEKDPVSGKYLVFLTISSNSSSPAQNLEFRAWDASLGRLLVDLSPNNINFQENLVIGSLGTPQPIFANVLTQLTYFMKSGWNWISFPLQNDHLSNVNTILSDLSPTLNDEIGTWNRFDRYDSTGKWKGSLDAEGLNTYEGFKIYLAKADTFSYKGVFINPSTEPIILEPKWNWIGMKSEVNLDIKTALSNLNPSQGDLIKNQQQFAIYDTTFKSWSGNLDFLSPQVGYMFKSAKRQELIYPIGGIKSNHRSASRNKILKQLSKTSLQKSIELDLDRFSNNMSMTAQISECLLSELTGVDIDWEKWMLVAYATDGSRGIVQPKWEEAIGGYLFYLNIAGEQSVDLSFRLIRIDGTDEIQLNQGLKFEANSIMGFPSAPYLFSCGQRLDCVDERLYSTSNIDLSTLNDIQMARYRLSSDAQLPQGFILKLMAGHEVELLRGFQVIKGAALEVEMDNCDDLNKQ